MTGVVYEIADDRNYGHVAFATRAAATEYLAEHPTFESHSADGITERPYHVQERVVAAVVTCRNCGVYAVTSKDPEAFPYCKGCFYTGASHEHMYGPALARIAEGVPGWEASVWHTGGGCFAVAVTPTDFEEGVEYYFLTDGEAGLLGLETGAAAPWGFVGRLRDTEDGTDVVELHSAEILGGGDDGYEYGDPGALTTEEVIAGIRRDIESPAPFTDRW